MQAGKCLVGVDIGGTNLRMALITYEGVILSRHRVSSAIAEGREPFCARLLSGIDELCQDACSRSFDVTGIGVGIPGLVGSNGLIHSSVNMRPLDGFNLAAFLKSRTGINVVSENDANAIAVGEQLFGAGRGISSFMAVTIGTGLGSGLVLDGRLWTGKGGFASEFGHVTVDPLGLPCPCGNKGCLEQYVSAGALNYHIVNAYPELAEEYGKIGAEELASMARAGDVTASYAFRRMGMWFGTALSSLLNLLNLDAVIVGGGVGASLDLMEPAISKELSSRCFPEIANGVCVLKGELGDDAGLLGAAALVSDQILPSS
jgi:glucokinase